MAVGEFRAAGGLGHDPRGGRVIVEPASVVDQVREYVRHPTRGCAINRMHAAECAAGDDLFGLAVMDAVTMLMAHDGLHTRLAYEVAHGEQLGAGQRRRLFERDQFGPALEAELDHLQAHLRWCTEAKNVRLPGKCEGTGVAAGRWVVQISERVLQARWVTTRNAD